MVNESALLGIYRLDVNFQVPNYTTHGDTPNNADACRGW